MSNANESAYPVQTQSFPARDGDYTVHESTGGLTKREHFAGLAMQALILSGAEVKVHTAKGVLVIPAREGVPKLAVQYADNLLVALAEQSA